MKFKAFLSSFVIMLAVTSALAQTNAAAPTDKKTPEAQTAPDAKNPSATPQNTVAPNADVKPPVPSDTKSATTQAPASEVAPSAAAAVDKDAYIIGAGDELQISVWKEPDLSRPVPVRPDGKITLPLVGDVQAAGVTPHQLETDLTKQLTSFVASPSVTVIVQGVHSRRYNIMGEVLKPGTYELAGPPETVLDAIALAGGLKDFAKKKKIYILRVKADGTQDRLPFNYAQVIKGENMSQNIVLQTRDTIVVP